MPPSVYFFFIHNTGIKKMNINLTEEEREFLEDTLKMIKARVECLAEIKCEDAPIKKLSVIIEKLKI